MATAQAFYKMVDKIKEVLIADENVNAVTYGDIIDVATEKSTMYPLAHLAVNTVNIKDHVFRFNITLLCMDLIDHTNKKSTDTFNGGDNVMDIYNTQLAVVSRLMMLLKRTSLRNEGYQIIGEPQTESFTHRFEDDVAGWALDFEVDIIQDMQVC